MRKRNALHSCCNRRARAIYALGLAVILIRLLFLLRQLSVRPSLQAPDEVLTSIPKLAPQRKFFKFYILPLPELTSWLIGNYTKEAYHFYERAENEERAEVWLHRGLERMTYKQGRTHNRSEADVIFISAYLHLNQHLNKQIEKGAVVSRTAHYDKREWAQLILDRITDKSKPHVVAIPTWNPNVSMRIGIKILKVLNSSSVNLFSLGFERNTFWQHLKPHRIIPIPYVVQPALSKQKLAQEISRRRVDNFVFYRGDTRKKAVLWSGCNRTMVKPLSNRTDMDVQLVKKGARMTQSEYNLRILRADYCLILCGDTPTSRSLASSMLHGCIPIRVGSRLRGICEPPCRPGWGWTIAPSSHLPYSDKIDWNVFPEVSETDFASNPLVTLRKLFSHVSTQQKAKLRSTMKETQFSWVYGWDSPVNSTSFGDAVPYIWDSVVSSVL